MKKTIWYAVFMITALSAEAQRTPIMGWSSWNAFGLRINEEIIKNQASAMVSTGLDAAGYKYINIDDGYFGGRADDGTLKINAKAFPNGLEPVVTHIHQLGLKAGIYSDAGHNTCGNSSTHDKNLNFVGLYEHDQQDCNLFFNDLKFDFLKVDFCGGMHLGLNEQKRYSAIHQAILNTGRKDIVYNVCRWDYPGNWVHDVCDSWRISHDISASWPSVSDIIKQNLYLSAYAYDGHYNDMDMLEVGRGMKAEEDKTHFALWCIMDSPLLIGCDMTKISDTALALLKNQELIALNQDSLHLQAYVAKYTDGCYVLVKDFEKLQDKKRAVAIYNPQNESKDVTLSFRDVCLDGKVALRDLFTHTDLDSMTDSCKFTVPAHGTRVLMLQAEKRLEQTRYEAENAYISDYQELTNNQIAKTGIYNAGMKQCSGQANVGWIGYSDRNDLRWNQVFSKTGGDYEMTIGFLSNEERKMNVEVNGTLVSTVLLKLPKSNEVGTHKVAIHLNKGCNCIRFYYAAYWMPDIDYIDLAKINAD